MNKKLNSILESIFLNKIIHNQNFCNIRITSIDEKCGIKLDLDISISRKFIDDEFSFYLDIKSDRLSTRYGGFPTKIKETIKIEELIVKEFLNYYIKNDCDNVIILLISLIDSLGTGYENIIENTIRKEANDTTIFDKPLDLYTSLDKGYEVTFCY